MSTAPPRRAPLFRRVAAALAVLTLPVAGLVALAGPAEAAASATATYTKVSDWGTGFEGKWTVKNTGTTTLSSWAVEWDYPAGTAVTSAWDATVTSSGTHWTGKNVGWNGTLAPGATISFGFNGTGSGAPSGCKVNGGSCDGGTTPTDTPPGAPGTPTASGVTDTGLTLGWAAATDDKGIKNYDVYRNGTKIATVTGTSYTDSGLTKGTTYGYTVTARDTIDQTGPSSGALSVTTTGGTNPTDNPPGAPGTPTASNVGETGLTLSWTAATDDKGVKNYDVFRNGAKIATVTGTSYNDSGLTKGTSYTYSVTARDTIDQTGPSSGTLAVTTPGGPIDPPPGGPVKLGYFTNWGVYGRNYHVKNLVTSGSAAKITHINYAFGNVQGGACTIGDAYADYDKAYTADQSVDGVADTWDQPLRGNFNQLRKLKKQYPNIKVLWSFGGWTWSGGFGQAAANPTAFANSCYNLVEDPRWADVFDGIDLDWEYPNACGLSCDTSGAASFKNMMQAMRAKFGANNLVTAAISADGSNGGKLDLADYAGAAQYTDFYNVMTYDFFGAWDAKGPTAPHSPLTSYSGIPIAGFNSEAAITKLKGKGISGSKLNLGIGFYGRGWTGVTQATPGGTATGPAAGTYEQGIEDYKVLKNSCPSTGTVAGTAYAKCGSNWWSYDTPATIASKMTWTKQQNLRGAFFWEFSGDTTNGELANAIHTGLQ
ncbi:glycoside hydrolase family 18 chitinase [Streptomyces sp. NPDC002812]|uniref:glycoside hydrolase family 18 chitinase n=1 Tax=unclassified Streptomyces TaxID=2593676 RepID=UPI00202EEF49|nr:MULTISPECIES: glycoside hydrolase family 18 chitinase [unclassified Streptomyces]MCM1971194.1 glycoside hydrolase family 18 chitinase [Streptomyces sp. G1]MCX5122456.1 glycoside hydrolase family 18 chitinase [Streptomyces sp. NBC_00347]